MSVTRANIFDTSPFIYVSNFSVLALTKGKVRSTQPQIEITICRKQSPIFNIVFLASFNCSVFSYLKMKVYREFN